MNNYMIEQWIDLIEQQVQLEYDRNGYVRPLYSCLLAKKGGQYETFSVRDFTPDEAGRDILQQHNWMHGQPICACFTAFMLETNHEDKPRTVLFKIIEDPITTKRAILLETEIEGKKRLIHDEYLTKFASFPIEIERFRILIDTGTKKDTFN